MNQQPAFFVEFEAYQHGTEDFQIKEIAVMDAAWPMRILQFVYLPPSDWKSLSNEQKKTYTYERRKLHHLHWHEGTLHFCAECLQREINRWFLTYYYYATDDVVFYTMGEQKVKYLQKILPGYNIVNYAAVHDVTIRTLPPVPDNLTCLYRNHGKHCAVLKCYKLYFHFMSVNVYES